MQITKQRYYSPEEYLELEEASAITLARFVSPQTILLWGGEEIIYSLRNKSTSRSLIKKYRYCIEYGLPDYNITVEAKI
ncbi:hypothetical protein [Nostoc sp. WHI]|uniref:hypothetical protein n=1 Tax=Nostoc sp. WHI TaxID=2650611 RepID=UPI0018C7C2A1|nr:hypothetical protein [Nostoc sp. WHI]MBG1265112.1 hypothetical protein [Nostoc sp. WHI]